jgi:3-phosphoshikimate 1-carboxyvinyltransferase
VRFVLDASDILSGEFNYPEQLENRPYTGPPLSATVTVPGSKSITNRALVLAALASRTGPCTLTGALRSEDTIVMVDSLQRLGFEVKADWSQEVIWIGKNQTGRVIPAEYEGLFVANSGTSMRFLTAMVSLGTGPYVLDGVDRMRERPIDDLMDVLRQLGVDATTQSHEGGPLVQISGKGWQGSHARLRMNLSSQFLSGLMMVAPFSGKEDVRIDFDDAVVSRPYLDMTDAMLHEWGVETSFATRSRSFVCKRGEFPPYRDVYAIEPDASAASYFWAAAAILGGRVTVSGLTDASIQGDVKFVDVLEQMGCRVEKCDSGITVHGRPLRGVDVEMNAISDTVMTLGVVACFAEGPTRIRNVAHIRHKETDRIAALATELRRLGAEVEEFADGLAITPRPLHGATVETYNDHRMAMSLALIGLKVPGVIIKNPGCVAKTYPGFWRDFDKLTGR